MRILPNFRQHDIERLLRRAKPQPSSHLIEDIELAVAHRRSIRARSRAALAGLATAAVATPLLVFGGAGYAAAGAQDALQTLRTAVFQAHTVGTLDAATDQYGKVTLCHNGSEISVDESAVAAHLALGDTFGTCPVFPPPVVLSKGSTTLSLGSSNSNHVITGATGDHTVILGNGKNKITLGSGNNKITVGNGDNKVTVGNGNNVIKLGKGDNTVHTGTGHNVIYARNGKSDYITCAPGNDDTVYADPVSIDYVSASCAHVYRAKYTG